jgi:hypothetical protein
VTTIRARTILGTGDARATGVTGHARVAELAAVQTDAAYAYRRM